MLRRDGRSEVTWGWADWERASGMRSRCLKCTVLRNRGRASTTYVLLRRCDVCERWTNSSKFMIRDTVCSHCIYVIFALHFYVRTWARTDIYVQVGSFNQVEVQYEQFFSPSACPSAGRTRAPFTRNNRRCINDEVLDCYPRLLSGNCIYICPFDTTKALMGTFHGHRDATGDELRRQEHGGNRQ